MFKSNPIFEQFRKNEREKLSAVKNRVAIADVYEEGIVTCKKCGSKNVYVASEQTRSRDEGTTAFAKCVKCKATWIV